MPFHVENVDSTLLLPSNIYSYPHTPHHQMYHESRRSATLSRDPSSVLSSVTYLQMPLPSPPILTTNNLRVPASPTSTLNATQVPVVTSALGNSFLYLNPTFPIPQLLQETGRGEAHMILRPKFHVVHIYPY
jgi:hypothetical protein